MKLLAFEFCKTWCGVYFRSPECVVCLCKLWQFQSITEYQLYGIQ